MHTCTCSFHTTAQVLAWSPDEKYARNAHIAHVSVKGNISDQQENKVKIKDPTQIKSFDSLPCEIFAETRSKTPSFNFNSAPDGTSRTSLPENSSEHFAVGKVTGSIEVVYINTLLTDRKANIHKNQPKMQFIA